MNVKTCLVIALIFIAYELIVGTVFMYLWNWIMPYLFKLPMINFWMALGLVTIIGMIGGRIGKKANS